MPCSSRAPSFVLRALKATVQRNPSRNLHGCHLLGHRRTRRRCPAHSRRTASGVQQAVPQGGAGPGADHLQGQEGRCHLHRRRGAARDPQGRVHGHLGEDHRDQADRPGRADLPGQHPGGHPHLVLRAGQQDRRGRRQGGPGDRYGTGQRQGGDPGVLRREVLRGAEDRRQAAGLRRPLHQARGVPGPHHPGHRHRPQRLPPRRRGHRLPRADADDAARRRQHPGRPGHPQDHRADGGRARPHQRVPADRAEGDHPAERRRPGDHPGAGAPAGRGRDQAAARGRHPAGPRGGGDRQGPGGRAARGPGRVPADRGAARGAAREPGAGDRRGAEEPRAGHRRGERAHREGPDARSHRP